MKLEPQNFEAQVIGTIESCLQRVPEIRNLSVEPQDSKLDKGVDFRVTLVTPRGPRTLIVEAKSSGQPRLARAAVNQLSTITSLFDNPYGIFVAPYISEKSAEICREANVGYIDLAGNCRINFDGIFIEIKGNPNRYGEKRELRSLYAAKAERVLRVLLGDPKRIWKTAELAEAADVSMGQVFNVRKRLEQREWVAERRPGIELTRPDELLQEWARQYRAERNTRTSCYSMKSVGQTEALITDFCNENEKTYALTGSSGAARYAPFTTYRTATIYVKGDPVSVTKPLDLKVVSTGSNLVILTPYDEGVFQGTQDINDQKVASPIQCYLDLQGESGRSEEAATALMEASIRPSWQ